MKTPLIIYETVVNIISKILISVSYFKAIIYVYVYIVNKFCDIIIDFFMKPL